ncbi:MAG TPA: hypothetical protein VM557_05585 [Thermoanaerobaculia bacterium]|nr:hypothetical protein [Thermoanaerobaculia bacterium]
MAESGRRGGRVEIAGAALPVALILIFFRPRTILTGLEAALAEAVERYQPLSGFPPPPGFPLHVGIAQLIAPLLGAPFEALSALSIVASVAAFLALAIALIRMTGSIGAGIGGAIIFNFAPVSLLYGAMAVPDMAAAAFVAAAMAWAMRLERMDADPPLPDLLIFGAACAASIGFSPRWSLSAIPLLLVGIWFVRQPRGRGIIAGSFVATSFLCVMSLTGGFGSLGRWWDWEVEGFRALLRQGREGGALERIERFVLDPWGPLWLAIPVILLALGGLTLLLRGRDRRLWVLLGAGLPHLILAALLLSPADGPRRGLAGALMVAGLAAAALAALLPRWGTRMALVPAVLFAGVSFFWTLPLLQVRSANPSPAVKAAEWASNLSTRSRVLFDPSLRAHAFHLLPPDQILPLDEGLSEISRKSEIEAWILADGDDRNPLAARFWWPETPPLHLLGTQAPRVVSVVPLPPLERYEPLVGISRPYRTDGTSFRWMGPEAAIVVPEGAFRAEATIQVPSEYPHDEEVVRIYVDERFIGALTIGKQKAGKAVVRIPDGGVLAFVAENAAAAATGPAATDPRSGLKLLDFRRLP